jgi:hypothetical protein
MEIENQRKDRAEQNAAEEEKRRKAEAEKFTDDYFKNKFRAQGLNI